MLAFSEWWLLIWQINQVTALRVDGFYKRHAKHFLDQHTFARVDYNRFVKLTAVYFCDFQLLLLCLTKGARLTNIQYYTY